MIKYVIQAKKNPLKKRSEVLSAGCTNHAGNAGTNCKADRETLHRVECWRKGCVLDALQYKVIEALENGNTVRLGDGAYS